MATNTHYASAIPARLRAARGNVPRKKICAEVGISVSALAMYETGKRIPKDEIKVALAKTYNTSVDALFF